MKIRNGFVSNSSSTSFVLTCAKDDFQKIVEELGPQAEYIVRHARHAVKEGKLFGCDVVTISGIESSEDGPYHLKGFDGNILDKDGNKVHINGWEFEDEDENYVESYNVLCTLYDIWSELVVRLEKEGKDFIHDSECC